MTEQLAVRPFEFSINQGLSSLTLSAQGEDPPGVPVKSEDCGDTENSPSPDGKVLSYLSSCSTN